MNSFFKLLVEKKFLFLPEKKKNIHFSEILGYLLPIGEKFYTRFKELLEEAIQQKGYNKLETSLFLSKAQVQNSGHLENFYEYSFFCPSCSMKEETTSCIHKKSKQKKGGLVEVGDLFLRPELSISTISYFEKNLLSPKFKQEKLYQVGKAFRNEVRFSFMKYLEFEQLETCLFLEQDVQVPQEKRFKEYILEMKGVLDNIDPSFKKIFLKKKSKKAHYALHTEDLMGKIGPKVFELGGFSLRKDLVSKKIQLLECSLGLTRLFFFFLSSNFDTSFHLAEKFVPYRYAISFLKRTKELEELTRQIIDKNKSFLFLDSSDLGKKYEYADFFCIPFFITVDFQTLKDETVTIRKRETKEQSRIKWTLI